MFKQLMKQKHKERLHLYNNFDDIYKVLPRDIFPSDLGGKADVTCKELASEYFFMSIYDAKLRGVVGCRGH